MPLPTGLRRALLATLERVVSGTGRALRAPERLRSGTTHRTAPPLSADYPGDFTGRPDISYTPHEDRLADPGEVVWAWVPYEEDHGRGKDRPVLLIGRDGDWLLGVPLTSKDHHRDVAQEARAHRYWTDVGTGAWDAQGRTSEARVDRIVRIAPQQVRRTGAALDRPRFDVVARAVLEHVGR